MATSIIKNSPFSFFTKVSVPATGTTFNLPNNYRGTMYIYDSSASNNGMYMVYATASGVVNYKAVSTASNITINIDTANKITVTPTSGSKVVLFINAQGIATV